MHNKIVFKISSVMEANDETLKCCCEYKSYKEVNMYCEKEL